ncbi:MAG: DUF4238 domain-containing protein [Actinomycetota bacterium]
MKAAERKQLEAFLLRARLNEGSAPRKHHTVPSSYIARWAVKGRVRLTNVESGETHVTTPAKACRISDFYRLEAEHLDPDQVPPLLMETLYSEVESWARKIIDSLVGDAPQLPPGDLASFAWFLAFQFTRGAGHREELKVFSNEMVKLEYGSLSDEGIRSELRRRGVSDPSPELVASSRVLLSDVTAGKASMAPPDASLAGTAAETASELGEYFLARTWIVYRTPPILLTCDEPIVTIGGPGTPRDERAGVANAGVIIFPLDPTHLLAMMRTDLAVAHGMPPGQIFERELDRVDAVDVCKEVSMNAHRWSIEQPTLSMAELFPIPTAPEAWAMEAAGTVEEDGQKGVVYRNYKPTRWKDHPFPAAWPVASWWL